MLRELCGAIGYTGNYMAKDPLNDEDIRLLDREEQAEDILAESYTEGLSDIPQDLVGKTGKAVSTLRPSGRAEIDGSVYSVESDGSFIPSGTPLVVVRVRGSNILVKPK